MLFKKFMKVLATVSIGIFLFSLASCATSGGAKKNTSGSALKRMEGKNFLRLTNCIVGELLIPEILGSNDYLNSSCGEDLAQTINFFLLALKHCSLKYNGVTKLDVKFATQEFFRKYNYQCHQSITAQQIKDAYSKMESNGIMNMNDFIKNPPLNEPIVNILPDVIGNVGDGFHVK